MKGFPRLKLCLAVAALAACSEGRTPVDPGVPPLLVSFTYACRNWFPAQPAPGARVLADLHFAPAPVPEDAVLRLGGQIVHRYDIPALRVVIRAGDIPSLPRLNRAEGVTDPLILDVRVFVRYSRAVTQADLDRLSELGARDIRTFSSLPSYVVVTIADPALRQVRALSGVSGIEPDLTGCFT